MKARLVVLGLTGVLLGFFSAPAQALVHFGARVGYDFVTIDAHEVSDFALESGMATIVREEIENPLLLGAFLETSLFPVFDLEIAGEAGFKKYSFEYTTDAGQATSDEIYFTRLSALITLKKNLVSFPPVSSVLSLYGGAGAGLHFVTPLVGQALILDKLEDATDTLDPDDIVEAEVQAEVHALAGARLKPPVFPFGISVEARYTIQSEGDYDEPGSHLSAYAGLYMGF